MSLLLEKRKPYKPEPIHRENFESGVFANSRVLLGNWTVVVAGYHGRGALQSDVAIATAQLEYVRRIALPPGLLDLWMSDFRAEAMVRVESPQDAISRFTGVCVRHIQSLTHYMIGFYSLAPNIRLRIYRSLEGLPVVTEGHGGPCIVGSAIVGRSPLQTRTVCTFNAVGSLWTVRLVDPLNVTLAQATVPPGLFTVDVDLSHLTAPQIGRWRIYDQFMALQYETELLEVFSLDTYEYGGPGTYWLLADIAFPWTVNTWYRLGVRIRSHYITALVNGVEYVTAIDPTYTWGKPVLRTVRSQSRFDDLKVTKG